MPLLSGVVLHVGRRDPDYYVESHNHQGPQNEPVVAADVHGERKRPWQATSLGLVLQQGAAWAHCRCEGAPGVGQPDDVHSETLQCTASRQCDEAWPSCR